MCPRFSRQLFVPKQKTVKIIIKNGEGVFAGVLLLIAAQVLAAEEIAVVVVGGGVGESGEQASRKQTETNVAVGAPRRTRGDPKWGAEGTSWAKMSPLCARGGCSLPIHSQAAL